MYPTYPGYQQPMYNGNHQQVTRVNGRNGAEAYMLAPNSSALLLDESAPVVWLKQTDGAGYPTLTPYKITPYQEEAPADINALEKRIEKLEEIISNDKSDTISINSKRQSGESRKN